MEKVSEEEEKGNVEMEIEVKEENGGEGMVIKEREYEKEEYEKKELINEEMGWNIEEI